MATPTNTQNNILLQQAQDMRFELVEVPIDAVAQNQSKFNFPVNNNLQGKRVAFIDAYCIETMSVSPLGRPVIGVDIFLRGTLSLYTMIQQRLNIQNMPFPAMNPFYVTDGTAPNTQARMLINNQQTDWNKCQIDVGLPIGPTAVGKSFIFGVYYFDI